MSGSSLGSPGADDVRRVTEDYYDSHDADRFYQIVWGGEDIHIGLYDKGERDIAAASRRTVQHMASLLALPEPGMSVVDFGAGYGGAARHLARIFGAQVTCLNLSKVENERNRLLTAEQGLADRIEVVHGSFEAVPLPDASMDAVWSQDAILHSADRRKVMEEAARVLKPGGQLILTDPMQADHVPDPAALQPIYDRIHLPNLASVAFYRETLAALGFKEIRVEMHTDQMATHYGRVRENLAARRGEIVGEVSADYVERMIAGLEKWVDGARSGLLAWGILHFRKT